MPRQVALVAQPDVERAAGGEQALEGGDVLRRSRWVDRGLEGLRQALGPARREDPAALAVAGDERLAGAVVPRARDVADLALQRGERQGLEAALGRVGGEVDLDAVALAEHLVRVDGARSDATTDELAQAGEDARVVARLRQVDDERRAAAVGVHPAEHADAVRGDVPEQRDDRAAQVRDRRGEQLVLREGVEERDRGLVVVRALDEVLGGEDRAQLAVQERGLARGLDVRLRGEQAEHARLAAGRAVRPDAAHADVVHARAAVHGRQAIALGDDEQVALDDPLAQRRVERLERHRARPRRVAGVRQQPEPRARGHMDAVVVDLVVARAEEDEVAVEQPAQEGDGLGDLLLVVAPLPRPREHDHVLDVLAHRPVVAHDATDVLDRRADRVLEAGQLVGRQRAVELEVHDRLGRARLARMLDGDDAPARVALGADDRVDDADDAEATTLELAADRVHEERQVLGVRLEDRAAGLVAVLGRVGVERADRERRRAALRGEPERPERLAEQTLGVGLRLLFGQPADVLAGERPDGRRAVGRDVLVDEREQPVEHRRTGLRSVIDDAHTAIIARGASSCRATAVSARWATARS